VPKLYVKTTLVTMDGIGNQRAPGGRRDQPDLKTPTSPLLNNP
jgi:hypothetical protein